MKIRRSNRLERNGVEREAKQKRGCEDGDGKSRNRMDKGAKGENNACEMKEEKRLGEISWEELHCAKKEKYRGMVANYKMHGFVSLH